MNKKFCYLIIILISFGCRPQKEGTQIDDRGMVTIKISDDFEISTQDLIDTLEFVPLSTPGGIFVGAISNLIVTKERIIVVDNAVMNHAMVFDRKGKYIATLSRKGRAPSEYVDLTHVSLMPDGTTIALHDNSGSKLLFFDSNGRFIESKTLPVRFHAMEYITDTEIVCATYGLGGKDPGLKQSQFADKLILFADDDFKIKGGFVTNIFQQNYHWKAPHLRKNKSMVFVNPSFCDTIYSLSPGKNIKAKYHIDLSGIAGAMNFGADITNEQVNVIREKNVLFFGDFIEADRFAKLNISCPPRGGIKSYLYNKDNGTTYLIKPEPNEDRRFAGINVIIANTITEDDRLVAAVPAYQILMTTPEQTLNKYEELKTLTEDSNPVLIFYTLKLSTNSHEKE